MKTERFDIEARVERKPGQGLPDKDQMRSMMRALLAERFELAIHNETREIPVLAFVLLKPGKTGPHLQAHPADSPCPTDLPPSYNDETVAGGYPLLCNALLGGPPSVPGRVHLGSRNVTIAFIADALSGEPDLGRPMIDQTGLTGTFDFTIEWLPQSVRDPASAPPAAESSPDFTGPAFQDALREQLGIKLLAQRGSVNVLVFDRVEHPSAN